MAAINEDQACELEALRSIYPTELTVENETSPVRLSIQLGTGERSYNEEEDDAPGCVLSFELPAAYPEVPPEIELSAEDIGLDEADVAAIVGKLNELALENVGLPMVFTIASAAQVSAASRVAT